MKYTWPREDGSTSHGFDAFGLIRTTFRELDWKILFFFERTAPISPNAWPRLAAGDAVALEASGPLQLRMRVYRGAAAARVQDKPPLGAPPGPALPP